jgi:hypothetical protein
MGFQFRGPLVAHMQLFGTSVMLYAYFKAKGVVILTQTLFRAWKGKACLSHFDMMSEAGIVAPGETFLTRSVWLTCFHSNEYTHKNGRIAGAVSSMQFLLGLHEEDQSNKLKIFCNAIFFATCIHTVTKLCKNGMQKSAQ